jgi:hypothetical protein
LGLVIWGYIPDWWTIAGTMLIIVSGLTALERQAKVAASPAPQRDMGAAGG